MKIGGNTNMAPREEGPPKPADPRTRSHVPIPASASSLPLPGDMPTIHPPRISASSNAPGRYDPLQEFRSHPTTSTVPVNTTVPGPNTSYGHSRHPIQIYPVNIGASLDMLPRGEGPPKSVDPRTRPQVPIPTSASLLPYVMPISQPPRISASSFAPGRYDPLQGSRSHPNTSTLRANTTAPGPSTSYGHSRHAKWIYPMHIGAILNTVPRGEGPPKSVDPRTRPQVAIPTSASSLPLPHGMPIMQPPRESASSIAPGWYGPLHEFRSHPTTSTFPANATAPGPHTSYGHNQHPPTTTSTHTTTVQSAPAKPRRPTKKQPLRISDFVMVYLTISGPPLHLEPKPGRPDQILRIKQSAAWCPRNERVALWSRPETHRTAFNFWLKPQAPVSAKEARKLDLRNVAIPMHMEATQEEFWASMRRIYPSKAGSPYRISEWAIACPHCGADIVGYPTDWLWSVRFLTHLGNSCRNNGW